jgi:hypothetical protein
MPSLGDILGGGAAADSGRQLFIWGVLYGFLSAVFEPITTEISQEVWEGSVQAGLHRALSPDELATMVVRGWISQGAGQAEAAKSGVDQGDFANMVNNRRNPIAPEEAAVALRRKIIPESAAPGAVSFLNAIQEGNLGDQWATVIQQLATQIPSPADVLQGVLQGQLPPGTDGPTLYEQVGGQTVDPNTGFNWYEFMFNTRGAAPTPNEAATMALRGIIPWGDGSDGPVIEGPGAISFYQAFLEGPWRNKWETAWREMSRYLPPPRTVTAMLKQGSLTVAQATDLLTMQGLTPDLVAAYIHSATTTKTAAAKTLSEANVLSLLNDKLIDVPTAVTFLEQLGYPANEAEILASTSQAAATISSLKANVSRVETIYLAHKIDRANALTMLAGLGLDAGSAAAKVADWDILKQANIRVLTPAQIESAWQYEIYDQQTAQTELEHLGYTPYDAWTLLSIKAKQKLPNPPPFGPGVVA